MASFSARANFSSAAAAYESLAAEMKERIDGLTVVHDVFGRRAKTGTHKQQDENRKRQPKVTHPLVRIHPHTGRKCLYVSPGECTGIVGMDDAEALPLIDELAALIPREQFRYKHDWQPARRADLGQLRGAASGDIRLPLARGAPSDVAYHGRRRDERRG